MAFSGYPPRYLGWSQYRAFGAAALDLCAVADGSLDAYATVGGSRLGSWDYLGGMLVCTEAGAVVDELAGMDLVVLGHEDRRRPVAASTAVLLEALKSVGGPVAFRFRAFSSVGRAAGLQPAGRRFESGSAHRPRSHKGSPEVRKGTERGQESRERRRTTATGRETDGRRRGLFEGRIGCPRTACLKERGRVK